MTMASAPAIHLEGVVKTFPNPLDAARPIRAVDGISLKAAFAEEIKDHLRDGNVTLLYAGKDPDKSQIPTLRAHINKHEHIS